MKFTGVDEARRFVDGFEGKMCNRVKDHISDKEHDCEWLRLCQAIVNFGCVIVTLVCAVAYTYNRGLILCVSLMFLAPMFMIGFNMSYVTESSVMEEDLNNLRRLENTGVDILYHEGFISGAEMQLYHDCCRFLALSGLGSGVVALDYSPQRNKVVLKFRSDYKIPRQHFSISEFVRGDDFMLSFVNESFVLTAPAHFNWGVIFF